MGDGYKGSVYSRQYQTRNDVDVANSTEQHILETFPFPLRPLGAYFDYPVQRRRAYPQETNDFRS